LQGLRAATRAVSRGSGASHWGCESYGER
jgi:hypothetical protein